MMGMPRIGFTTMLVLAVVATTAASCDEAPPPKPTPPPSAAVGKLTGTPMAKPTGLRLLASGHFMDVDAGTTHPIAVTTWLPRPGRAPLLVDEIRRKEDFGPLRVTTRKEPMLPGGPMVIRLDLPALTTVIPAGDGNGLWTMEYADRSTCSLRQVDFDGRDRRAARPVDCRTRLVSETPHGLWVMVSDTEAILLDPGTLAERMKSPRVDVIDEHRYLVATDNRTDPIRLHDMGSGKSVDVPRPPHTGWAQPHVSPLSPDGRWLALTFGEPGVMPQVMDVWLLDLSNLQWTHVPAMPIHASLKNTSISFAPDGRLVMLGNFSDVADVGHEYKRHLLATWRPGEPQWALLPFERPATSPDEPHDTRFLVY